jgi:hypothetical protein
MSKEITRKEMVDFLASHFRYDTMSSWNAATSYAKCIKLREFSITHDLHMKCYDFLDNDQAFEDFNDVLWMFELDHNYEWQIGRNGRSGGYLVLYKGGRKFSGYRSVCTACGQGNCLQIVDAITSDLPKTDKHGEIRYSVDKRCGRCNADARVNQIVMQTYTSSGQSVDRHEDFEEWDDDSIKDRYNLVKEFDQACENACNSFLEFVKANTIEERTIMVPKKIRVAVPIGGEE